MPGELSSDEEGAWSLAAEAVRAGRPVVGVAPARLAVPGGAFGDPVATLYAAPLPAGEDEPPLGVLLLGTSPSRALDDTHRAFLDLLVQQVAVALRNARAHEDERRRAEALAELDRVKTAFFTNVSHEFRTPLTLLLGPLGDALAEEPDGSAQAERLAIAQRGAERLLVLVNDLLSFSRLEAGAEAPASEEADLAQDTADAASAFRAAVERAGLELVVDCPPLPAPVAYDRGGWEKVVANLLSNALKHTFVGRIAVRLRSDTEGVVLEVADTGIGIAEADQERLFERFSRVPGAASRSHEGTGIGLALVRELVRLQGGEVSVSSAPGAGSTFRVAVPWPALRRPAGDARTTGAAARGSARASAAAAAQWEPRPVPDAPAAPVDGEEPVRVLVADDNADMRAYVVRVLQAQGWAVTAVADGQEALEAVHRDPPDLLLTDVMMPRLDGFELLRALRAAPETRGLPVVVLSARAGAEAGVEGLDLGADDYVAKPFVAGDLVARLRATLDLARVRSRTRRRVTAPAGTVALMATGRALEQAVQVLTEQARALLDGERATTTLRDAARELVVTSPAASARPVAGEPVEVEVRSGPGPAGVLAVWPGAGRGADPEALALLDGVASALGLLLERSWTPGAEQDVALALQSGLLPGRLPEVDGVQLAGGHRPVTGQAGAGWYDVLPLPGGGLLLCAGDVAGQGVAGVTTAGRLRSAARAHVEGGAGPADVVERLRDLAARLGESAADVLVARLELPSGDLRWSAAGPAAPIVLGADGSVRRLDGQADRLGDGETLLLATGGLLDDGADGLSGAARASAAPDALVEALLAGPAARRDGAPVLAVQRPPAAPAPAGPAPVRPVEGSFSYPRSTARPGCCAATPGACCRRRVWTTGSSTTCCSP